MNTVNVELFGRDPKVQKALNVARHVSVTKSTVLIVGEAGVGKKMLSSYIHESSNRAEQPLIFVDCAEQPQTVENNILGYRDTESGRFMKGALERANRGTVVFSNIDALEDDFQKRLYKILTELEDYDIDLRVVATTTKNLSKLVGSGRFYRGLFTFISANSVVIPPLREREGDLAHLAQHFVNEFNTSHNTNIHIDESTMKKIVSHYWTHNVFELKTVLENSLTNIESDTLMSDDLEIGEKKSVNMVYDEDGEGIRLMSLKEAEKLLIKKALVHTSENRTQAAKILGVSIRTLRNKINEYRNAGNAYFVNLR